MITDNSSDVEDIELLESLKIKDHESYASDIFSRVAIAQPDNQSSTPMTVISR
jgi:hypothetical protein